MINVYSKAVKAQVDKTKQLRLRVVELRGPLTGMSVRQCTTGRPSSTTLKLRTKSASLNLAPP